METIFIIPGAEEWTKEVTTNPSQKKQALWRFFSRFDRGLHSRKVGFDRIDKIDPKAFPGMVCKIPLIIRNGRISCTDKIALQKLQGLSLDLILYFEDVPLDEQFHYAALHGVCSYTGLFLEWRIPEKMQDFLFNLYKSGSKYLVRDVYTSTFPLKSNWTFHNTSKIRLFLLMVRIIIHKFNNRLFDGFYCERWEIACRFSNHSILNEKDFQPAFHLKPPIDKIYGDPFPIKFDGRYFLFFEEMEVDGVSHKLAGHISVMEIDREKGPVGKIQKVLQRDYHLSYPFIFLWNNEYYMLPETHQNRSIELYRCVSFPGRWEFCRTLLNDIQTVDVTLFEKDGIWWMFAAVPQSMDESTHGIYAPHTYALNLYYSNSPLGEWQPHPLNPVKRNRTSSRCAGSVFFHDGYFYRPAQDCSPRYGYAVVFNRIEKITVSEYIETEDKKILPPDHWRIPGIHTYNACEDLQAIDFIHYRSRFLP
jgi:hypothetical protein